jgi:hypothetical protein
VSDSQEDRERRRFHRILFDAPALLRQGGRAYRTHLVDLSLKGALLGTPPDWTADAAGDAEIEIPLDEAGSRICMQCEVAHQESGHLGLRCRQIDMDSITHLRRLVELNLGDAALLERELEALG